MDEVLFSMNQNMSINVDNEVPVLSVEDIESKQNNHKASGGEEVYFEKIKYGGQSRVGT